MSYTVRFSLTGAQMVRDIRDLRIQDVITKRAKRLENEPNKQGSPLLFEFDGYRNVRVEKERDRIIYRVDDDETIVIVAAVGIRIDGDRDDIYEVARRLLRQGLLG
jgi:mRNA interferase RelE/StbE